MTSAADQSAQFPSFVVTKTNYFLPQAWNNQFLFWRVKWAYIFTVREEAHKSYTCNNQVVVKFIHLNFSFKHSIPEIRAYLAAFLDHFLFLLASFSHDVFALVEFYRRVRSNGDENQHLLVWNHHYLLQKGGVPSLSLGVSFPFLVTRMEREKDKRISVWREDWVKRSGAEWIRAAEMSFLCRVDGLRVAASTSTEEPVEVFLACPTGRRGIPRTHQRFYASWLA